MAILKASHGAGEMAQVAVDLISTRTGAPSLGPTEKGQALQMLGISGLGLELASHGPVRNPVSKTRWVTLEDQ